MLTNVLMIIKNESDFSIFGKIEKSHWEITSNFYNIFSNFGGNVPVFPLQTPMQSIDIPKSLSQGSPARFMPL